MVGFNQFACKQNYIRLMCKYSSFGHSLFTVRLSDGALKPGHRALIGVSHQGLTIFDQNKKLGAPPAPPLVPRGPTLCFAKQNPASC